MDFLVRDTLTDVKYKGCLSRLNFRINFYFYEKISAKALEGGFSVHIKSSLKKISDEITYQLIQGFFKVFQKCDF